jgi:hypothetical protein
MNEKAEAFISLCEVYRKSYIAVINKGCELLKDDPKQCRQFLDKCNSEMKVSIKELNKIMLTENKNEP